MAENITTKNKSPNSPRGENLKKHRNRKNINAPIWIHCASLGEFEQGRPIIEAIKLKYPTTQIILTFFFHRVMKYKKIMHKPM